MRTETLNWLMWQMGSAPFLGGGFGHFYTYAPEKLEYPINRYAMEVKRQLDVLDRHLAENAWMAGDYSIADMAIWPWYGNLVLGRSYPEADKFLDVGIYTNLKRWADAIEARPAAKRGRIVNKVSGDPSEQMAERHSSADFAGRV
jgi:GST-like protein